jgi:hypothetical protein
MRDRNAVLSVRPKSGNMLRKAVRSELAFLDQRPDRRRGDDFGFEKSGNSVRSSTIRDGATVALPKER